MSGLVRHQHKGMQGMSLHVLAICLVPCAAQPRTNGMSPQYSTMLRNHCALPPKWDCDGLCMIVLSHQQSLTNLLYPVLLYFTLLNVFFFLFFYAETI